MADEPFHRHYRSWAGDEPNHVDHVSDTVSLDRQLAMIFERYDGLKLLDYQLPEELCTHLLLRPDIKVVSLKRRNLLQTIVSEQIALQSGIWKIWELKEGTLDEAYDGLEDVPLDRIRDRLAHMKAVRNAYNAILDRKPSDMCLDLEYEAVYTSCAEENRRRLHAVIRFLGIDPEDLGDTTYYLDPGQTKMNNEQSYRRLPNAQHINDRFGCDETGWLFDGDRA